MLAKSMEEGLPMLLEKVGESFDAVLDPVLARATISKGRKLVIKLGDKELDYNPDFKLYITTRLGNPHYTPEVSTKTTIVNFVVKEDGLKAQLLGLVVRQEEPRLEEGRPGRQNVKTGLQ